jgi:hypothetical protein
MTDKWDHCPQCVRYYQRRFTHFMDALARMEEGHPVNDGSPNQHGSIETTLAPYDFPSISECVEVLVTEGKSTCESRFGRIVNEQIQRYRKAL